MYILQKSTQIMVSHVNKRFFTKPCSYRELIDLFNLLLEGIITGIYNIYAHTLCKCKEICIYHELLVHLSFSSIYKNPLYCDLFLDSFSDVVKQTNQLTKQMA